MKGQIWHTNVKYLGLSTEHFMFIYYLVYQHMCVQFQCEMLMIAEKFQRHKIQI